MSFNGCKKAVNNTASFYSLWRGNFCYIDIFIKIAYNTVGSHRGLYLYGELDPNALQPEFGSFLLTFSEESDILSLADTSRSVVFLFLRISGCEVSVFLLTFLEELGIIFVETLSVGDKPELLLTPPAVSAVSFFVFSDILC